jgi:hypothetical protein
LIKFLRHVSHAFIRITPRSVSPTKEFNRILASPVRRSILKKSGVAVSGETLDFETLSYIEMPPHSSAGK